MIERGKKSRRAVPPRNGTLTLCGLGIDRPQDVTLGAMQALKECEVLFYIHGDGERLKPFFRTFCSDIRLYAGARYDRLTTEQKIEAVAADVCAEMKNGKRVAYVTYGHPLLFSDGFNVLTLCRANGFDGRVLPAPSAVDSILASCGELSEKFSNGYLVCTADAAVLKPGMLKLDFPVILLCLDAAVGRGRFGELCGLIEEAYPAGHRILAVKCRDSYGETVRLDGRVSDLRGWERKIVHMMSLVVPAR
ncbi:MAG: SAM-dependent methyltransferase [Elusimicrobiota bacterium]